MPDYKQLCVDLVNELHGYKVAHPNHDTDLIDRARAELAKPEPEVPTVEELMKLAREWNSGYESIEFEFIADYARAVLARCGRPAPIPVTERLPGPENCNSDGEIWAWRRFDSEGDMDNGDFWCLAFCKWLEDEDRGFTHWLPADTLPLPQ